MVTPIVPLPASVAVHVVGKFIELRLDDDVARLVAGSPAVLIPFPTVAERDAWVACNQVQIGDKP